MTFYRVECDHCNCGPWSCDCPTWMPGVLQGSMCDDWWETDDDGHRTRYYSQPRYDYVQAWGTTCTDWRGWDSPGGRISPPSGDRGIMRGMRTYERCAMATLPQLAAIFYDNTARLTSLGFSVYAIEGTVTALADSGQVLYDWSTAYNKRRLGPASILQHHYQPGTDLVPYSKETTP